MAMRRFRSICFSLTFALVASLTWADTVRCIRVVDCDTIEVSIAGHTEKVRLIGVDTPETVHPNKPVERFGREASAFTKRMAEGQLVRLESDADTRDRDGYGRLLRYVYLPDGKLLNAEMIAQGYGFAYTKYPVHEDGRVPQAGA